MAFYYLSSKYKGETLDNKDIEISDNEIKYLYEENQRDKQQCEYITNNPSILDDMNDTLQSIILSPKITGFLMIYPHGSVIGLGERNHYYRGERELFPSSTSILQRTLKSPEDFEFEEFISYMRIHEFKKFILKFEYVQYWRDNCSDIHSAAIAQHYGIKTNLLDITNDFDTALFFATCCFENNKWRPLTKKDIEKSENSRYGRIFHAPKDVIMLKNMVSGYNNWGVEGVYLTGGIWPIGFQPFMRCHSQYGYVMNCEKGYCLQEDKTFEKLIFKHSEKLSEEVFQLMNEGRKIYPYEALNEFEDIINRIATTKIFSEDSFEYACEKLKYSKEKIEDIKNKLNKQDYVIGKFELDVDVNRIKKLDDIHRKIISN